MARRIVVDPITRIEGHLKLTAEIDSSGVVQEARCHGEMFRGIEKALEGKDARTAQQITQRTCGVCPYAHAEAASKALEQAMGIRPNRNGQLLRNLIVAPHFLYDYLLHFYTLSALDFIDVTAVLKYQGKSAGVNQLKAWVAAELKNNEVYPAAPFLPRYEAAYAQDQALNFSAIEHYLQSFDVMRDLHKMVAIFGAKSPHVVAIEAGGVTTMPTMANISQYEAILRRVETFITESYLKDVVAVAKAFPHYFKIGAGYGNFLSGDFLPDADGQNPLFAAGAVIDWQYRPFDVSKISENHSYAFYENSGDNNLAPLNPEGEPVPLSLERFKEEYAKVDGKYSWTKRPEYDNEVMEVGPIARILTAYLSGRDPAFKRYIDGINKELGITIGEYNSVMGRHLCRALSAQMIIKEIRGHLEQVEPGRSGFEAHDVPTNAQGYGITEATRGMLSHFIQTDDRGYIKRYSLVVPTTWNIGPRTHSGKPGAVEQMLLGTRVADAKYPIELARIVRSTDPCMACSVH